MRFQIATVDQTRAALEYFNAFHDGFVRRLSLISHDVFEARGAHTRLDLPDLELLVAHYNYQQDMRPHDQVIRATFRRVTDVSVSLGVGWYPLPINHVDIAAATRTMDDGRTVYCLRAVIVQPHLSARQVWDLREDVSFAFEDAEIEEI